MSLSLHPTVLSYSIKVYCFQALHFLREEFQPVAQSAVLHQLDKIHLTEVLKNPFLQASELEVLQAVLKWGECELIRRMEDRGKTLLLLLL